MKKNVIIIGVSAAGIAAAAKLRALDKEVTITCLTAEAELPYNRCLLADYVAGSKELGALMTKGEDFFAAHTIALRLHARVVRIDPEKKQVSLASGQELAYDQLFIGTGRGSRLLPIPGAQAAGVFSFYDLRDAVAVVDYLNQRQVCRAVIIGGGLTGLECATALAARGIATIVVERDETLLAQQLGISGSEFLERRMRDYQAQALTKAMVTEIFYDERGVSGVSIQTVSGPVYYTSEMVIMTVGGAINSALASDAGLTCEQGGIVVDECMRTSDPAIFAGGDVCRITDLLTGEKIQSCLWTDAVMQGMVAAHSMCGMSKPYKGSLLITGSHLFGLAFVSAGAINQKNYTQKYADYHAEIVEGAEFHHEYIVEGAQEKRLRGFALLGSITMLGELRQALLNGEPCPSPRATSA